MTERLIVAYVLMGMLAIGFCIMVWSIWYNSATQKNARYRTESKRRAQKHAEEFDYRGEGK